MKQALINMLTMQNSMNTRVHEQWATQDFEWYRAIWIECGELIEHYGYKWWKKQDPDLAQVQLEVIDIWHFGLSALFRDGKTINTLASEIEQELGNYQAADIGVREATEALALDTLQTHGFSPTRFWDLMVSVDLDFDGLYSAYVGKNVLNFFRQDHGYKDGSYVKTWSGREDNEHLVEVMASLDHGAEGFAQNVYNSLQDRYRELALRE